MSAPTPLERNAGRDVPSGRIAQAGVSRLRSALKGNASAFADWSREPMTKLVLGALQCTLTHPPAGLVGEEALVQYGFTQGLSYALQLLLDPSALWPDAFGDVDAGAMPAPDMDFSASLDEALN